MSQSIKTVLSEAGFTEDKNFYNRDPKRMLAALKAEKHYAELFIEKKDWYVVFIYGPEFMNGPCPHRYDILNAKDLEEMENDLKKKL